MGNYKDVGQEDSYDCGFFACYVANLWDVSGGIKPRMEMTQEDVYRARNEFRGSPNAPLTKSESRAMSLNVPNSVVDFLTFLGCRGYRFGSYSTVHQDRDDILTLLRSIPTYPSNECLLLTLGLVHWITVLGRQAIGKYDVYDPGRPSQQGFERSEESLVDILSGTGVWYYVHSFPIVSSGLPGDSIISNPNTPNPPTIPRLEAGQQLHIVKPGDTLSQIAIKYFGDYKLYTKLHDWKDNVNGIWNRREIGPNPNVITPGMRIIIPPKSAI